MLVSGQWTLTGTCRQLRLTLEILEHSEIEMPGAEPKLKKKHTLALCVRVQFRSIATTISLLFTVSALEILPSSVRIIAIENRNRTKVEPY